MQFTLRACEPAYDDGVAGLREGARLIAGAPSFLRELHAR